MYHTPRQVLSLFKDNLHGLSLQTRICARGQVCVCVCGRVYIYILERNGDYILFLGFWVLGNLETWLVMVAKCQEAGTIN